MNTFEQYRDAVVSEFVRYGFTGSPFYDNELTICYHHNLSVDCVYAIGCDLACNDDLTFGEALEINAGVKL